MLKVNSPEVFAEITSNLSALAISNYYFFTHLLLHCKTRPTHLCNSVFYKHATTCRVATLSGTVMVFIWSERSGRSRPLPPKMLQSSLPKKCREASTTKKCHRAAPPKKCRKGRLKICSKCSPPQKRCEAALQKVPCYV